MKTTRLLCICFVIISRPAAAADTMIAKPTEQLPPVVSDVNESAGVAVRDPFNYSQKLRMQAPPGRVPNPAMSTTFLPDAAQENLPGIRLKGILTPGQGNQDEPLALLEINGQDVYLVKAGDEVTYDPARPASAIRVKTISRLSVTVEVGRLGNIFIIR